MDTTRRSSHAIPHRVVRICSLGFVFSLLLWPEFATAQSSVASTSIRPFVTGLIPVIGRGGFVGGVLVDADGVVARSDVETLGKIRELRLSAMEPISREAHPSSSLRKISLRGLVAAIEEKRRSGKPVTDELQNLAGLQRLEYVFMYPERQDIVLAGFAEGWKVNAHGEVVGLTTGQPVLQLDDLVIALRTAKHAASGDGITCSIDPTEEGSKQLQRVLSTRGLQLSNSTVARLEEALGPQTITLTGVPPGSHFAYVLVAADFMLKRLGMNFEPAPIDGMPSYMELLQASSGSSTGNAMPRFWLAPHYEPLLKDAEGQAWQLRGSGVQALAEDGAFGDAATFTVSRKSNTPAQKWADTMTAKYDSLSGALPVFAQLRNCMDFAVIAALFVKEDLPRKAGCDLSLLLDDKRVKVAEYHVPKAVPSRVSLIRKGRQWIVGISGGVQVDSWSVLNDVQLHPKLATTRKQVVFSDANRWWWD